MACSNFLNTEVLSALQTGQAWHRDIRASFLQAEDVPFKDGNKYLDKTPERYDTFTTEKAITDKNGEVVKVDGKIAMPDKVDYRTAEIFEIKPFYPKYEGEDKDKPKTEEEVYYKHQAQIDRYIKTYEKARGVTPVVHLLCYPAD